VTDEPIANLSIPRVTHQRREFHMLDQVNGVHFFIPEIRLFYPMVTPEKPSFSFASFKRKGDERYCSKYQASSKLISAST
jgi:hypothetical protein